ncbi:hypothetical protein ABKR72_004300 [Salmonella enterica subsp. enterica serovar Typhimurium]|nr:hypothetical protein [Salmonella enterica subsp. enterica serovar Typhimurium]EDZ7205315.1 hypothetical protein [Salmonella enterica subsp. enterica serovar Typhimurium]EJU3000748.1 hypothetical protein [Salmonella enterica subsp. enterica serovar Typhimurium]
MLFPLVITLLCFTVGALLLVVIFQRREYRRLRADADGIVMRYLAVAERFESLVRELTEPYGGVLYDLMEVEQLAARMKALPDREIRETAERILERLNERMRMLLKQVSDRYRLSDADRQRWLSEPEYPEAGK